jgi:predicted RNA polymerase sigma factor
MLLQESRRAARSSPAGELILLRDQDRSLWNREQIAEGVASVEKALKSRRPYTLQAAIAAVHAEAESAAATGDRLLHFTTNWCEFSRRRFSISIAPISLPSAMVQRPV